MRSIIKNNVHILKLEKNENITQVTENYIKKHNLGLVKIEAIGMIKEVTLGFFKNNKYQWQKFIGSFELISFLGNVSWINNQTTLHAHIAISGHDFQVIGGHFKEGKVAAIAEMFITEISKEKILKNDSDNTNLKAWDL